MNRRGDVINNAVADPDTMIFKSVRDQVIPTSEADRLPTHVAFVTYEVILNFTSLVLRSAVQGPAG